MLGELSEDWLLVLYVSHFVKLFADFQIWTPQDTFLFSLDLCMHLQVTQCWVLNCWSHSHTGTASHGSHCDSHKCSSENDLGPLHLLFPSALNTFHRYPHMTYTLTSFSFPLRCQFFAILYKIALLGSAKSPSPVNYQAQTQGLLESSIYKGACQFHQLFLSPNEFQADRR